MKWNRTYQENTPHPKYLGVTLDRTLSYKQHIHNTNIKVATRNNLLRKLSTSMWGTNASKTRTTVLARSYSVAEYAAPVWARSAHAYKLDSELNSACREITGCHKPTNVEELYLLSGIALQRIRRDVCARVEKIKQETNETHPLHGKTPAKIRLQYRNCFLHSVKPANFPPKVIRCIEWLRRTNSVNLDESLARGHDSPWTTWRCLNRLRTGYTCSNSSGRNGNTSMETQPVYAVSRQKIPRACCNAPSLHDPAPWMTFQSSTTQQSLAFE